MGGATRPLAQAALAGFLIWLAWTLQPYQDSDHALVFYVAAGYAALISAQTALTLLGLIPRLIYLWWIGRPGKKAGTAAWAILQEVKKGGLLKVHKGKGYLAGTLEGKPVMVDTESSGLVLSPAGGGKTVQFVIPALCHNASSMLVPDLKATLSVMTKRVREKRHGHRVVIVNPTGKYENLLGAAARYNPLQILIDDWNNPSLRSHMVSDAQAIARQLYPEPTNASENQFFRNGSRKFMAFVFLYLVIEGKNATLSKALEMLSDVFALKSALTQALKSDALNGDLARLATDLYAKMEDGDPKQVESFREGAVQVLEPFSPSGVLAESTSTCDFRFADMRREKLTIYLVGDPTRMTVFAPWLGLLSWCALTELIRYQNGKSVVFLCDEITNFKIETLPSLLTLAREFKIVMWLIIQELEEWGRTYGKETIETLLSQTEVKIIFGARSHKTCRLISDMLGTSTVKTKSYNLGSSWLSDVSASMSDASMRLLTPEQVREFKEAIVFVGDKKPMRLEKIGYHQIAPWKRWVGINPLFGKKYRARTKLRM